MQLLIFILASLELGVDRNLSVSTLQCWTYSITNFLPFFRENYKCSVSSTQSLLVLELQKKKKKAVDERYLTVKAKVTKSCWKNKILLMNRKEEDITF